MKLAEAKKAQIRNSLEIEGCEIKLLAGSLEKIATVLEEVSELLRTKQVLSKAIAETEAVASIGENTMEDIKGALTMIEEKIRLLEVLSVRGDLGATQREGIDSQLSTYRVTRDTLRISVEKCNWETDLLNA